MEDIYNDGKIPKGTYTFIIDNVSERKQTNKSHYRVWKFVTIIKGDKKEIIQNMFPWVVIPLLLAVGYKEDEEGNVKWDDEQIIGKQFRGRVFYEPSQNDPLKEYPKICDFQPITNDEEIPF